MDTLVFVATRKDGCVGYFEHASDVPKGWEFDFDTGARDISDIMASMRLSKERTLEVMNHHWRRASFSVVEVMGE